MIIIRSVFCLQTLLDGGAYVDAVDGYGSTPLHYAAFNGYTAIVQVSIGRVSFVRSVHLVKSLLTHGANVKATDNGGWTPLHQSAFSGHTDIIWVTIRRIFFVHLAGLVFLEAAGSWGKRQRRSQRQNNTASLCSVSWAYRNCPGDNPTPFSSPTRRLGSSGLRSKCQCRRRRNQLDTTLPCSA